MLVTVFPAASNAQAGNVTSLQFVITPFTGGLEINVPANANFATLASPDTNTVVTTQLDTVTVTDTRRASLTRGWTTNAVSTDLVTGSDSLTASSMGYSSGPSTTLSGLVGVTEHTRTSMDSSAMVETGATTTGNHVVSWRPTLSIPVIFNKSPGAYVGILTHSVF